LHVLSFFVQVRTKAQRSSFAAGGKSNDAAPLA
jgi:hypothetical protein